MDATDILLWCVNLFCLQRGGWLDHMEECLVGGAVGRALRAWVRLGKGACLTDLFVGSPCGRGNACSTPADILLGAFSHLGGITLYDSLLI